MSDLPKSDILSLDQASNVLTGEAQANYQAMISIGTDDEGKPTGWSRFNGKRVKLRLTFEDFAVPAIFQHNPADKEYSRVSQPPWCQPKQLEQLFEFEPEVEGRLFVHCFAGVSRSSAIALAFIASRLGPGNEEEAIEYLYECKHTITPNVWVVALADCILERDGALFNALARHKSGQYGPLTKYPEVMQTMDYARARWKQHTGKTAF